MSFRTFLLVALVMAPMLVLARPGPKDSRGKDHARSDNSKDHSHEGKDKCHCPNLSRNFTDRACALDWISHSRVISERKVFINGTKFRSYTLQHIRVYKGGDNLPTSLLVPKGQCGINLNNKKDYLLSGLLLNGEMLIATTCTQLFGKNSPTWKKVPKDLIKQLENLSCPSTTAAPTTTGTETPTSEGSTTTEGVSTASAATELPTGSTSEGQTTTEGATTTEGSGSTAEISTEGPATTSEVSTERSTTTTEESSSTSSVQSTVTLPSSTTTV